MTKLRQALTLAACAGTKSWRAASGAVSAASGVASALEGPVVDILWDAGATIAQTRKRRGQFQIGDHLKVLRGAYSHHGIYAGDDTVIHLTGRGGKVAKVTLDQFRAGARKIWVVNSPSTFEGEEIVRRAENLIGREGYSLLAGNCEHFCNWARSGAPRSRQVDRWAGALASLPLTPLRRFEELP
jgi:hypothetical protein